MNYLPMARNAGATILTQTKVEWLEKLAGGGWRIHGKHVKGPDDSQKFHARCRRGGALGGVAELHRDSAALGDARAFGFARAGHQVQRQRRFLRPGLQRRLRNRRAGLSVPAGRRGRRFAGARTEHRRPGALHRRPAGRRSASRSKISRSRTPTSTAPRRSSACFAGRIP